MMRKVVLILFLFLAPLWTAAPAHAQTPAQILQYLVGVSFNIPEQAPKAIKNIQLQLQNAITAAEEKIQWARNKYTSATEAIAKKVDAFKKDVKEMVGVEEEMNKAQTKDETPQAQQKDRVTERVKINMETNFEDEKKTGAEAENAIINKRKAIRQAANKDKFARLLVMKYQLNKIAKEVKDVHSMLEKAVSAANSDTSSIVAALQENLKLRQALYNLMAIQLTIETYTLDAVATQGLASMSTVGMDLEYKDEYQVKIKK